MNQAYQTNPVVQNTLERLDAIIASAKKTHAAIDLRLKEIEAENKKVNAEIDADILDLVKDVDDGLLRLIKATE